MSTRLPGRAWTHINGGLGGAGGEGLGGAAVHERRELAHGAREGAQVGVDERLRTVAERGLGVRVHVDDDAVGTDGDGGARERHHQLAASAGVRGVDDDGQVGTRNAANFTLLQAVGASGKPVMLKRGMNATIEEWLMAAEYVAQLRLLSVSRAIANLKSKLQRTNPIDDQVNYNRMFAALLELEKQRRELSETAAGPAV